MRKRASGYVCFTILYLFASVTPVAVRMHFQLNGLYWSPLLRTRAKALRGQCLCKQNLRMDGVSEVRGSRTGDMCPAKKVTLRYLSLLSSRRVYVKSEWGSHFHAMSLKWSHRFILSVFVCSSLLSPHRNFCLRNVAMSRLVTTKVLRFRRVGFGVWL